MEEEISQLHQKIKELEGDLNIMRLQRDAARKEAQELKDNIEAEMYRQAEEAWYD